MTEKIERWLVGVIMALYCVVFFCGCTSTTVQYGKVKLHRVSFLQSIDARIEIDGDKAVITYTNDGGSQAAGNVASAAAVTVIK